jgi:hypothetical protein
LFDVFQLNFQRGISHLGIFFLSPDRRGNPIADLALSQEIKPP